VRVERRCGLVVLALVVVAGVTLFGGWRPVGPGAACAETNPNEVKPMPLTLPDLPYAYEALEPFLSAETLHLHHDKHHQAYVNGYNDAEAKLKAAEEKGDFAAIRALCDALAFNYSGHLLHSMFWTNMKPGGGGEPGGDLAAQIAKDFGSFETFQAEFLAAANAVQGSGWAVLVWQPIGERLVVLQAEKHQNLAEWGAVPILVLDVWEHAYYLQYQNRRVDFTAAFMGVVNWDDVAARLKAAK
jgi:superoxide dismutase, Fe-Mn family